MPQIVPTIFVGTFKCKVKNWKSKGIELPKANTKSVEGIFSVLRRGKQFYTATCLEQKISKEQEPCLFQISAKSSEKSLSGLE